METVLLSIAIVALSVTGLALGVIFGRPPLAGSCGGIACRHGLECAGCTRHHEGPGT